LQIAAGHGDTAFQRLDSLRRQKRLPAEITESLVDLALGRNNLALALEVAEERGLQGLPDWLLGNLADAALSGNRPEFAQRMVTTLGEGFLHARPLLAARMAFARGDREAAVRWAKRAAGDPSIRNVDRLALAELYRSLDHQPEASAQLSELQLDSLPDAVMAEVARLYLTLGRAMDGLDRFDRLRSEKAGPGFYRGWSLLAASAGRGSEVEEWMKPVQVLPPDLLRDLYFIATDRRETGLALASARRIYMEDAGNGNRLLLANALIASGQAAEALPHLRQLLSNGGAIELEETYTAGLLGAIHDAKPGTAFPLEAELRDFWTAKLRQSGPDEKKSLDLIYGLLDLQSWDAVLPQLAALAHRRGDLLPLYIETAVKAGRNKDAVEFLKAELNRKDLGLEAREARVYSLIERGGQAAALPYIRSLAAASIPAWIAAYEEALNKLGRTEELAEFWKARAATADVKPAEKRAIAFNLLQAGQKDSAQSIFEALAQTASPDDPNVAELLYLWGPKPGAKAMNWLAERARQASGDQRAAWLRHIVDAGGAGQAAAIVSARLPAPGQGGALLDVYLRALAELRETRQLAASVAREVQALSDPERVRSLAQVARDAGETKAAETAYLRLLTLEPEDREAHHWLGGFNFGRANYVAAERFLGPLVRSSEGAYDDNFYFGEMLWRKGDRRAAQAYYGRTLRIIDRLPSPGLDARIARAHSLFRLGDAAQATQQFQELLAANPGNADLRADFGALLLENGINDRAAVVLSPDAGLKGIRLALLRAQFLSATGRKPQALNLLEDLAAANPNQVQVLADLALLEDGVGNHRRARSLLDRAERLDPGNEDLAQALAALEREQAPRMVTEATSRGIQGVQSESLIHIEGDQPLSASLRFHYAADQDSATIQSLRLADGSVAGFDGIRRRAEASLEWESENGVSVEGSLYTGGGAPGGGVAVTRPDASGSTTLNIELQRPYWEFAESLAQNGVRDRVGIRREITLGSRLSARIGGAVNRYGLAGAPNAASNVAATGGVTLQLASRPQLAFAYDFDGEYLLSATSRTAANGIIFQPLPLTSHEFHSGSMTAAKQLTRSLRVDGAGGIEVDRFGGHAPFVDLNLKFEPQGHFGAQVDFDRRLYFLDTARSVTSFSGRIFWRF
jgi:Flp pilus assembly protein TadD